MQASTCRRPTSIGCCGRNGVGIRFRVFEPGVKASADVLLLPQASRVPVATRINQILNRGA